MDKIELIATIREILGKKVRFLRRQGLTPANLYGSNIDSTALQIDTHHLKHTLAKAGKTSLISLKLDGDKSPRMVVVRDIQREPLSGDLLHVDLYQVKMEEKLKLDVPIVLTGEAPAIKERGGILIQNMDSLEVECLPANMPHSIEVDISMLTEFDQAIHVKELSIDEAVTILSDPDNLIVQIARSRVEVEIALEEIAAAVEAEAEAVAAEAEVEEEKVEAEKVEEAGAAEESPED
ncbi:MAG TPA: 50S ribosomal protein L25 [Dehalococcoidia bacterium]|nr:50S ribosomal protein L25 [Dehalococcoidia bacterium]